jgi:hypothetical protein
VWFKNRTPFTFEAEMATKTEKKNAIRQDISKGFL